MKYILLSLVVLVGLTQCKKSDPNSGNTAASQNIFNFKIDPNYLVDTVNIGYTGTIRSGFYFSYDNLNRVNTIKVYDCFNNVPVNLMRSCTFAYAASDTLPQAMTTFWVGDAGPVYNYKIYFFYNADKSKNRDSVINLNTVSQPSIRRYTYDSLFVFAKTKYYLNGSTIARNEDSASLKNLNCDFFRSDFISNQIVSTRYFSYYRTLDKKINPFTRLNIFPAFFMSNYLFYGNLVDGFLSTNSFIIDFNCTNNLTRLESYSSDKYTCNCPLPEYDSKNRITKKWYVDSLRNSYQGTNYVEYKYKN